MKQLFFIMLVVLVKISFGQIKSDSIDVFISGRIDTTNKDIGEIYTVFKNYLQTRPDSIRYNTNWNKLEQSKGYKGNIALFYTPFYNLGADPQTIFTIWKPFILTIEPKSKEKYLLRVALVKSEESPDKLLTILNINAVFENGSWVLQNTIVDYIDIWNTKTHKYLKYQFPQGYPFNPELAEKSIKHCDSIAQILNVENIDTFTYFICNNADEMGELFGYEYYYLNYTKGLTVKWRKEIYSSNNSEYYPHEFMHMIFNSVNSDSINYLIEEGLACFLGEYGTEKYKTQINKLAYDYINQRPTYTFDNLLNNVASWNGYQTAYPVGSILAEIVYEKSGYIGLRTLIESNTQTSSQIIKTMQKITKRNKKGLEKEFRKKLGGYIN
jgi:hypothetical protein